MNFWDERYAQEGFAYGKEPNDFLKENAHLLPKGKILCLAEGEGRNAVFLAQLGHQVLAVDLSATGLAKAKALAGVLGVSITTQVADLADFAIAPGAWDGIVSIFAHQPPAIRKALHQQVLKGLKPGGVFMLEAYTPRQLAMAGIGGPKQMDMLLTLQDLQNELPGLHFQIAQEIERKVNEGEFHQGTGAVVQLLARKPA